MKPDLPPSSPRSEPLVDIVAGEWDTDGRCRSPWEGTELRIDGAIPGELVRAEVTGRSRGAPVAWARVERVLEPAPKGPARREPPCPIHGACGACGLQHAEEGGRLEARVRGELDKLPAPLRAVLAPAARWVRSEPFDYRHKAILLPSAELPLRLGGFARGTHDVVDLAGCAVLSPGLRAAEASLRGPLQDLLQRGALQAVPPGSEPSRAPGLRAVVLRGNREGDVLATFIATGRKPARVLRPLAARLAKADGPVRGVLLQEHDGRGDRVTSDRPPRLLAGARSLSERAGGVSFTLSPLGFFQVNPAVLDGILGVLEQVAAPADVVVDLYCGGGVLGMVLARSLGRPVFGVDVAVPAVVQARADARTLGLEARFEAGRPSEVLAGADLPPNRLLVLDPPRSGCRPDDLNAALALAPKQILYVSCSAASLGRDAERLIAAGWVPDLLLPADMLPQTPHVEWIAAWARS